jgi:hypothetical protein
VADFIAACIGKATEGYDGGQALDIDKLIDKAESVSSEVADTIVTKVRHEEAEAIHLDVYIYIYIYIYIHTHLRIKNTPMCLLGYLSQETQPGVPGQALDPEAAPAKTEVAAFAISYDKQFTSEAMQNTGFTLLSACAQRLHMVLCIYMFAELFCCGTPGQGLGF